MRSRNVVVLDIDTPSGDRRLVETVHGTGIAGEEVDSLDAFVAALRSRTRVGLVAFEALWPDPQKSLRAIREKAPGARVIVAYSEHSPRLRLGQRLWAVGLCAYFIQRSSPPHELTPILRQAYADALIESSLEGSTDDDPTMARLYSRLRFLHNMSSALTNQRRVEGLVRELQMKLPQLIDYTVLAVLIAGERPTVHVSQNRPVEHEVVWKLAESLCAAVAPFCETPLKPEELSFFDGAPTGEADDSDPMPATSQLAIPMVFCGQLVGGIGLVSASAAITAEHQALIQLVGYQLATSIRNAQALDVAESESLVDELTGAYNRRYLKRAMPAEWRRTHRYKTPLSLALIDIDHFKRINDVHGHLVGDSVLHSVASRLRQQLRETDHLVRYGGEEFLLMLPETNLRDAMLVLERIRLMFAREAVYASEKTGAIQITISAGVAGYPICAVESGEELTDLADEALLRAKRSGRDRVCLASGHGFASLDRDDSPGTEKRRFSRIRSNLPVRLVELPDFGGRTFTMSATDVSAGGIAVQGPRQHLKRNAYALVYLGDEQKPLLSQVMWTRDGDEERSAGLQFIGAEKIATSALVSQRRRALVIAEDPKTSATIERVIRAAQYIVKVASSHEDVRAETLDSYNLLVCGASSLRGELGEMLQSVRARGSSLRIALINEAQDRRSALDAIRAQHADHLVSSASSDDTLFATLNKLLLEEYFGLKKYLLWGAETRSWTLTTSAEKATVLDGVKDLAHDVRCHPRVADLLVAAVDEMIINALYRPLTASAATEQTKPRPVTVECGSDGRYLGVAVLDEHGLFRDEDLFRGIGKALEHEEKGMPPDATHANLGFRIMLSTLSHLAINVDTGRCTEIIGLIDLRKTLKEFRTSVPSLGMFTDPK